MADWKDFKSKWGFSEGAGLEGRDFEARSKLVNMLNENPAIAQSGLRAVEYDRPGLHNPLHYPHPSEAPTLRPRVAATLV